MCVLLILGGTILVWRKLLRPALQPGHLITLFYDDRCSLCRGSQRWLQRFDWFGRYRWMPLSTNLEAAKALGFDEARLSGELCGAYQGRPVSGYPLYMLIVKINPLLCWAYPLLWLLQAGGLGPSLYRWVAGHRYFFSSPCRIFDGNNG